MNPKKRVSIFFASLAITLACGGSTFASATTQTATRRYIIKFKTSSVNGSQIVSKHNGHFRKQYKHINAVVADMTSQSVASLQKDSNIDYIEQDNIVKASATTRTNWGVADIKAPNSWQSGLTGKGVNIAIIDTGAGPHSDLLIAGGTNVINGSTTTSYSDDNGHGTHIAGIIAAEGLNGGVEGVAPGASVYAVKALNSTGSGYTSDIISGIDWAINNKMNIVSLSLGSDKSDTVLQSAVDTAYNDGLLIVAAAGNDGNTAGTGTNTEYPANYSSVIAVGAVDSNNNRADFSSTGGKVEVAAPGVNVESTYLNNSYELMSGTSMATPFVAGDLALLKQEYPTDTNVQLRQLLDTTVTDLGVAGRDSLYGFGLIQAPKYVKITAKPVVVVTPPTVYKTQYGIATGDGISIRTGPGVQYSWQGSFAIGTKINILGTAGSFYKVSYSGKTGYVSNQYVKITAKPAVVVTPPTVYKIQYGIATGDGISIRTGPGVQYSWQGSFAIGTKINILGTAGSFYKVSYSGKTGYVSNQYVKITAKPVL